MTSAPAGKRPERLAHFPEGLTTGEYAAALAYLDAMMPGGVLGDLASNTPMAGWSGMRVVLGAQLVRKLFEC